VRRSVWTMRTPIQRVAVIGAGTIGTGWASFFVSKGVPVNLFDSAPGVAQAAVAKVVATLRFLVDRGLLDAEQASAGAGQVSVCEDLEHAVDGADLVQEAVYESYEVKKSVFAAIDALVPPDVLLASSSSGLLMTEIQKAVRRHPGRCLIAHPINPVYLVPLVEIVPGEQTDPTFVKSARGFYEGLGKVPVTLNREVPGYLENRMTAALWREAIDLVHQGVASVEDVDRAIWAGPGLRYALMGPLMIYHLGGGEGGVRQFAERLGPAFTMWWADMQTWTEIPPGAVEKLEAGLREAMVGRTIAELAAWRDERLVELLKVLRR